MTSSNSSTVSRLHVEEVEPRARKTEPVAAPHAQVQHTAAMLAAFRAISMILAVRLLLLLSIAGAFYLAVMAMDRLSNDSLMVLCAYCLLTRSEERRVG